MELEQPGKWTALNAVFLVAGTCIGGGMLALPLAAGVGGHFPSLVWLAVCWLLMTASSLLLLEANLWMSSGDHVISMAKRFLGPIGQAVSWIVYLYICYASLVSYAAGGGKLLASQFGLSPHWSIVFVAVALTLLIYLGTKLVGRVNTILFLGMLAAYLFLVGMGLDEIKPHFLAREGAWFPSTFAIPLLLTSFSHQTMVPSLTPYLKRNGKLLRRAIVGGTLIAFAVYALWLTIVLGIVPVEGEKGLIDAYIQGVPSTQFLAEHVQGRFLTPIVHFFSFFAIVTSFIGMALGLFDFLSDGLNIPETKTGKIALGLLILIPVIFFALYFERAFLVAMETTGGIGDSIINGIIPVLMVWVGRYKLGFKSDWSLPGGRPILLLLLIAFSAILFWEALMLSTNLVMNTLAG